MISTVSSHADKSETFKTCLSLPKSKVIEELIPKTGHFDNKVLKSLHFKTICPTLACNIPAQKLVAAMRVGEETHLTVNDCVGVRSSGRCRLARRRGVRDDRDGRG